MSYLVLKRRPTEKISIGPDIVIEFLEFRGGQIKVGINAPKDVLILRTELVGKEKQV